MRPGVLPAAQRREVGAPVEQVVDLHQVDAVGAQQPHRCLHLPHAFVAAPGPDLGGEEGLGAAAARREQLAGRRLGAAVHRRAVEHLAAGVEQRVDHAGQQRVLGRSRARGRSRRRCRSRSPAALRRSKESGGCSSWRRAVLAMDERRQDRSERQRGAAADELRARRPAAAAIRGATATTILRRIAHGDRRHATRRLAQLDEHRLMVARRRRGVDLTRCAGAGTGRRSRR